MSELRKTPEGKEEYRADERNIMSELRKTPERKEEHSGDERNRISESRKTPEGNDINRERVAKLLKTPEEKGKDREIVAKTRETDEGIEKNRADERSRISKIRTADKNSIEKDIIKVREESMVDPSILHTDAYEIISSNWEKTKKKCLEYTCTIRIKQEWKTNMLELGPSRYKKESKMFEKCYKGEYYSLERVIELEIFKNRFEGTEE